MYTNDLKKLIYKFENLGTGGSSDGAILIGKAPFIGPKAWINILYPNLMEKEIVFVENELKMTIPEDYKPLLSQVLAKRDL